MRTGPPVRGTDLLTAHAPKKMNITRTSSPGNHIHPLIPNLDPISHASTEHLLLPGFHARIATNGPPYSRWFSNRWIWSVRSSYEDGPICLNRMTPSWP